MRCAKRRLLVVWAFVLLAEVLYAGHRATIDGETVG